MVRISCISIPEDLNPERSVSDRLTEAVELIRQAVCDRPDVICLPEAFAQFHIPRNEWGEIKEPLDGQIVQTMSRQAAQHHCYIICPVFLWDHGHCYNAAVLLDRAGEYVGRHDKVALTLPEQEAGIARGSRYPVFTCDFGKIGILICFDLNMAGSAGELKKNGADLIFFPSMFEGGFLLRQRAFDQQCFFASAVLGGRSAVIDPLGRVRRMSARHAPIIAEDINLNCRVCHVDYTITKIKQIKAKYGTAVSIDCASPEGRYLIASQTPNKVIDEILQEFEVETLDHYISRAWQAGQKR
jgi:beta-ureidopropionase